MTDAPVNVPFPLDIAQEVRRTLREAGEDLQSEIAARYGQPPLHPAVQRRYDADMEVANRCLRLAGTIDFMPWTWLHDDTPPSQEHADSHAAEADRAGKDGE